MKKGLNLFSGLGGNRKKWEDIDITSIEIQQNIAKAYSLNFDKDNIIITDAYQYLLNHFNEYDFIWASPPCQSHSGMIRSGRNRRPRYADFRLYEIINFLKYNFKGKWIVENVKPYYEPLIKPTKILGRHLIWSNFEISDFEQPNFKNFINTSNTKGAEELKKWIGIEYPGNIYYKNNHDPAQVLRNCVTPDLGYHIYKCAFLK